MEVAGLLAVCIFTGLVANLMARRFVIEGGPQLFAVASAGFVILTALETALSRFTFVILPSRYAIVGAVLWISLLLGLAEVVAASTSVRIGKARRLDVTDVTFVTVALLAALFLSHTGLPPRSFFNQLQSARQAIVAAYESGVKDPGLLSLDYANPTEVSQLAWLEHDRLGPWASTRLVELETMRHLDTAELPSCPGYVESQQSVSGGERYNGWAALSSKRRPFPYFAIVGRAGNRRGIGYLGVFRPDVRQAGRATFDNAGFMAFAAGLPERGSQIVLFDAGGTRPECAMPLTRTP
jgi:hypothetical protein